MIAENNKTYEIIHEKNSHRPAKYHGLARCIGECGYDKDLYPLYLFMMIEGDLKGCVIKVNASNVIKSVNPS